MAQDFITIYTRPPGGDVAPSAAGGVFQKTLTFPAGNLPQLVLTTPGDLLGRNAAAPARVPIGTNRSALVVDTTVDTKLAYTTGTLFIGTTGVVVGNTAGSSAIFSGAAAETIAIGHSALILADGASSNNVAIGGAAGSGITSGNNNTFVGFQATSNLDTGNFRIAIGSGATCDTNNHAVIGGGVGSAITAFKPGTNAAASLGTNLLQWSSLFIPPPAGGTATAINIYEETLVADTAGTAGGAFGVAPAVNVRLTRFNTMISMNLSAVSTAAGAAGGVATLTTVLPDRYKPSNNVTTTFIVIDNSTQVAGSILVTAATGVVSIGVGATTAAFGNAGNNGWTSATVFWNSTNS